MSSFAILLMLSALMLGALLGYLFAQSRLAPQLQEARLRKEELERRLAEEQDHRDNLQDAFKATASDVLSQSTTELLKLAEERFKALVKAGDTNLEGKKQLIDANLKDMSDTLKGLVDRSTRLEEGLSSSQAATEKLRSTTEGLRLVLSSSQKRGQWGERMVEDILQTVGLVKGINYRVHDPVASGEIPDFTFLLPKNKTINLDVKFPIDQYERYLEADSDVEADEAKKRFLSAVKNHVKDVAGRGYIDPAQGTVDYVMVFIPNESVYGFIHQNDPTLLDFALKKRIILCSPITLYAVLSLVRQAVQNFGLEERAGEILSLLEQFQTQWGKYVKEMEKMGGAIDKAKETYTSLVNVRTNKLEKPLRKITEIQGGGQENLLGE